MGAAEVFHDVYQEIIQLFDGPYLVTGVSPNLEVFQDAANRVEHERHFEHHPLDLVPFNTLCIGALALLTLGLLLR